MGLSRASGPEHSDQEQLLAYIWGLEPDTLVKARARMPLSGAPAYGAIEEATLRRFLNLATERGEDWAQLRAFILSRSWAFLCARMQASPKQEDREIVRTVMKCNGAWQSLLGLFQQLDPKYLAGELDRLKAAKTS